MNPIFVDRKRLEINASLIQLHDNLNNREHLAFIAVSETKYILWEIAVIRHLPGVGDGVLWVSVYYLRLSLQTMLQKCKLVWLKACMQHNVSI